MLRNIKIENFYSIAAEQELSFVIGKKDVLNQSAYLTPRNEAINNVACLVGGNASGKTSTLKALSFIAWLVNLSYSDVRKDKVLPFEPHKLHEDKNSKISIEFESSGELYQYYIVLNNVEIVEEYLGKRVQRMNRVFHLTRSDGKTSIKSSLKINPSDETRIKERKNVSLLSSLIDLSYLDIEFFHNIRSNVTQRGPIEKSANALSSSIYNAFNDQEGLKETVLSFSDEIDFGISDFKFNKDESNRQSVHCIHENENVSFALDLIEESNGTQKGYHLLATVFPTLNNGGVVVLDEIESGLHPFVIRKIVSLFESEDTNPKKAQILFSTHQHILMSDRTKTQIFIAEKCQNKLETEVYRLDDVEDVRNDENYFNKYLAGTYGGTPNIHWF